MKTVEELFKEIEASKDLQKEITSIGKGQYAEVEAFLKKHDCDASAEDFVAFMKNQKKPQTEGEIEDGVVEAVAGGLPGGPSITAPRPIYKPQGVV